MKKRYRLIRRGERGSKFYCVDSLTGKRVSLATANEDDAEQIVLAKNQALRQPALNLQIAKAYLAGSDSGVATRNWQQAMDALVATKKAENQRRWKTAIKDNAFDPVRRRIIVETRAEELLAVVEAGTVSTNVFLRKLHNFCQDMNWLPWPIIPKRQWPAVHYGIKRAITRKEHQAILERETNPERKAFYQLAWHLGASQSDLASLRGEDIDCENHVIGYARKKTGSVAQIHFGQEVADILATLPKEGLLFPYLNRVRAGDRATEFKQRCRGLGISGVSLHSYRYAWAERALKCGYPERFAQQALGHNSKAVHHAYSKHAEVTVPSLDDWEKGWKAKTGAGREGRGAEDSKAESRKLKAEMGTEDGGRKTEDGGQRSEDSKAESRKLKAEMGAGQGSEFEMPKAAVVQVDFQGADAPSGQCSVAGSQ